MAVLGGPTVSTSQRSRSVRSIKVTVLEGVDTGKTLQTEGDALTIGTAKDNDLILTDETVSRYHVELKRSQYGIQIIDHASTNGTRIGPALLRGGQAFVEPKTDLQLGSTKLRITDGALVDIETSTRTRLGELRAVSPLMQRLMAKIEKIADVNVAVLILGETGTGKELVARALHEVSSRSKCPFVTVDCASLPSQLFNSELFGHERGAFTGAAEQRIGAFEHANGGTLFLDEIGELPANQQAALLGVLERRRFKRVGGTREVEVDVRLVSATHRDLRAEVNNETFRLDLFYRLAVVLLETPPLRDRPEDIPVLVEHFLREAGHDEDVDEVIRPEAMQAFTKYRWPGNIRELRNVVAATAVLGEAPHLSRPSKSSSDGAGDDCLEMTYRDARDVVVKDFEERYLTSLLKRSDGNIRQAARVARMDRSYLMELLKRHGMR